jgi:dienelactone hydrolase
MSITRLLAYVILVIVGLSGIALGIPNKCAEPLSRRFLLDGLKAYWGNGPDEDDIVDPDVKIIAKTELVDHWRWHISYMVEDNDRAFAYILLPKPLPSSSNKLPLVLCPHPTNGMGKDLVCGIYDRPVKEPDRDFFDQRKYALDLVRRGFICFAPDMAGYGQRVTIDKPHDKYNIEHVAAFKEAWLKKWPGGRFPHYKQLWDVQSALDFLVTYDFIDTNNIGMIGHSLGGWTGVYCSAYDTRIKATVINAGGGMNYTPELWQDNKKLTDFLNDKSLQNLHINLNIFTMLTAPRAVLYIKPLNDYVKYEYNWLNHLEAYRVISDYYRQAAGGDENYDPAYNIYFHNQKHTFKNDSRQLAYAWLEAQLKGEFKNTKYIRK